MGWDESSDEAEADKEQMGDAERDALAEAEAERRAGP
jgi:hypothetical protein